jgi:two-component system, LytTR family, response regulator
MDIDHTARQPWSSERAAARQPSIAVRPLPGLGADKLVLRTTGRYILVPEAEIAWIDAAGNRVRFHVGAAVHVVAGTLSGVERILRLPTLVRIQRSTILNLGAVREVVRSAYGDLIAVLADGTRLTVGRSYRKALAGLLGSVPAAGSR